MPRVLIIGDDVTGINASAALLVRRGFRCASFFAWELYEKEACSEWEAVAISTNSRGVTPEEAEKRVLAAMKASYDSSVKWVSKRIDSTLRGNMGAEIKGMRSFLASDTITLVVPAFPSSGRTCKNGRLLVHQVPLEETAAAKDPKAPVLTSQVISLLEEQLEESVGFIQLEVVEQGADLIERRLQELCAAGYRTILLDAVEDKQVLEIAQAAARIEPAVLAVDPGPFTAALTQVRLKESKREQKILLAVGSTTAVTRRQMADLQRNYDAYIEQIQVKELLVSEYREKEIARVVTGLTTKGIKHSVIGMVTVGRDEDVLDMKKTASLASLTEEEVSLSISKAIAEVVFRVMEKAGAAMGGLFVSGGDVTWAVCQQLGATCIQIEEEVLPLAVFGHLRQGPFDGCPIITKGGLIGDDQTIGKCVDYLIRKQM